MPGKRGGRNARKRKWAAGVQKSTKYNMVSVIYIFLLQYLCISKENTLYFLKFTLTQKKQDDEFLKSF